jgi:hypothetical protein
MRGMTLSSKGCRWEDSEIITDGKSRGSDGEKRYQGTMNGLKEPVSDLHKGCRQGDDMWEQTRDMWRTHAADRRIATTLLNFLSSDCSSVPPRLLVLAREEPEYFQVSVRRVRIRIAG